MSYPTLTHPDTFLVPIAGVHEFFYNYAPADWTPSVFARHTGTVALDEFSASLSKIDRAGTFAINKYARQILKYLKTPAGMQLFQIAVEELDLKLKDDQAARAKLKRRLEHETNFYQGPSRRPHGSTPSPKSDVDSPTREVESVDDAPVNNRSSLKRKESNDSLVTALGLDQAPQHHDHGLRLDAMGSSFLDSDGSSYVFEPTDSMRRAEAVSRRASMLDYFVGEGIEESDYKDDWKVDDESLSLTEALLGFRAGLVETRSLILHPHQKLAVNFIFLAESEEEMAGLQQEMEDDTWIELWKRIRGFSTIPGYSRDIVLASGEGAWNLAYMSHVGASEYIETLGPKDPILRAIFSNAVKTQDLWQNQVRNEESFVKAFISPLLDAVFGPVRGTFASWSSRLATDKSGLDLSSELLPDYQLCTKMRGMDLNIVSLEAKLQGGKNPAYKWDDKTKLGHTMKAALNTLLSLSPLEEVKTFGILVEGYHVTLYEMLLPSEAVYIMKRMGQFMVPRNNEDFFSVGRIHAIMVALRDEVETILKRMGEVKVKSKGTPLVPDHWRRPSYGQPMRIQQAEVSRK